MNVTLSKAKQLRGAVTVPGDKSISHRAVLLSALADGESRIEGISNGEDVQNTMTIVEQLGATVTREGTSVVIVARPQGLSSTRSSLDCGNSGTTMRLVAGVVSGLSGTSHLVGDASLSKRPMDRVAIPLRMMGAQIVGEGERVTAPLTIDGGSLRAISYDSPVGSAQIKSAILFAGLFAQGETTVREPIRSRTATEDMMVAAGIDLRSGDVGEGRSVTLVPSRPRAHLWKVPGDPSQAAFFCVAGVIHSDAQIVIDTIDDSRERTGFISVLQRMGALIQWLEGGQLSVTSSALQATEVDSSEIPSVDEVPILVVAAAAATGVSRFTDMSELRVKESDRFAASISLANALGARSWQEGDDFCVEGLGSADEFLPVNYVSNLDHRLVMSAAVAAACGQGGVITGAEAVASSYPNFFQDLNSLQ